MKVKDLLEADVVDFTAARKKKATTDLYGKLQGVQQDIKRHYEYERQATDELAHLHKWMEDTKKRNRLPGFESIDDVGYFLIVDTNMPSWAPEKPSERIKPGTGGYEAHVGEVKAQQKKIRQWYASLSEANQKKFQMIAHHAPRLKKVLDAMYVELRKFQERWAEMFKAKHFATQLDAQGGASYLDTEIRGDRETLDRVLKVAAIIGL
jgi:hypothetical protein